MFVYCGVSADNLAVLSNHQYIDETPETQLEQFNFDLIDTLDLDDNLNPEQWKKPEKKK